MKALILLIGLFLCETAVAQTIQKGSVTPTVNGMRMVDGGEITSLAADFTLGTGTPFTIKLVPKDFLEYNDVEYVNIVFYQADTDTSQSWPVSALGWTGELFRVFKASNAALLVDYRIFWAAGSDTTLN